MSSFGEHIRFLDGFDNGTLMLPYLNESDSSQDNGIYMCTVNNGIPDGLLCLTPFSTIFQLYRGGQFYFREKTSIWRKPIILRTIGFCAVLNGLVSRTKTSNMENMGNLQSLSSTYTVLV
jgi:hypothetical protein